MLDRRSPPVETPNDGFTLDREKFRAGLDDLARLSRRLTDLATLLAKACPKGIDVYFENVGGHVWDAVFPLLYNFARIPVYGLISQYNDLPPFPGPDRFPVVMRDILAKRFHIQGPAGAIEMLRDEPGEGTAVHGTAVIAHPHPLFAGTMENKVVQTLLAALLRFHGSA